MRKTILITGIDGFIGNALYNHLKDKYYIIGIDKSNSNNYSNSRFLKFIQQDINDEIPKLNKKIFAVIHLAAKAGVRESYSKFESVCRDNILATHNIIKESVNNWKPIKLLIASSSSVYGLSYTFGKSQGEIRSIPKPISPYAISKLTCEYLLKMERYQHRNIQMTSLRFFTVYGPNQRKGLAVREFIDGILNEKPITVYGDGNQRRDFTYIEDVCNAIEVMLRLPIIHSEYNIGSGVNRSLMSIIHDICNITKKEAIIRFKEKNRFDVDYTLADITRMKEDFWWQPKTEWIDGLEKQIEWQRRKV